jgi:ATP-dependent protease ClpP protease subunit
MKEVLIDDVIGYDWWTDSGITAKSVQKQLEGIEAGEDIKVTINSPGGSVYEGIVIFNLLRDYAKSHAVSVRINCIAMSMAAYIALAPRTVDKNAKITASDNSVFMIHNPWGVMYGDYRDFKKTAEYFEKLSALYGSVCASVSGKPEKEIREAMDNETFYVGKEISDSGYANDFETIAETENESAIDGISAHARDNIIINAKFASNKSMEKAHEARARDAAAYRGDIEKAVALFNSTPKTPAAKTTANKNINFVGGSMKPEELLAQNKTLYEAVFALGEKAGIEKEKARVNAHFLLGEKSDSLELAAKYIKAGVSSSDETAQVDYFAASMDNKNLAARKDDNPGDVNTGGGGGGADDAKLEAAFAAGFSGKDLRGKPWAE